MRMEASSALQRTTLYPLQKGLGGKFVDFHGWELPVQFSSILQEHQAVRERAGIFDVSHMGQVFAEGPQALDFLQTMNSNDVARAAPGKAVYSHLLNEKGGVVDDVIISCLAPGRYLVVVNAATAEKDFKWLSLHSEGFKVRLKNESARYGMVAVQGPVAAELIGAIEEKAPSLPRFGVLSCRGREEFFITRTGYTGEDGFEVIALNEEIEGIYQGLLDQGRPMGVLSCGLGARDTLRLEAGYLLYGQDVDEEHTPLEAGYEWVVKFGKRDFMGKSALLRQKEQGLSRRLLGFKLREAGVPRPHNPIYKERGSIGDLTSATYSPTLKKGIGVGYVSEPDLTPGTAVEIEIHGRKVGAEVAQVPFYRVKRKM